MIDLFKSEQQFQTLLQMLSENYMMICDAIDTQGIPDIKRSLQKLQEKKTQLKTAETAL